MTKRIWSDEQLGGALSDDALHNAEQITGGSIHSDPMTQALGMDLFARGVDAKKRMLEDAGDAHYATTLEQYHDIISRIGFQHQASVKFRHGERGELFSIWWEPSRGILLKFDTYGGNKVNSGSFYYNWRHPKDIEWGIRCRCTSSGHYTKCGVWVGYHDCREAIAFHIRLMDQHGDFVVPWIESQRLGLYHYGDKSEGDLREKFAAMDKASAERFLLLPQSIRDAVTPSLPTSDR